MTPPPGQSAEGYAPGGFLFFGGEGGLYIDPACRDAACCVSTTSIREVGGNTLFLLILSENIIFALQWRNFMLIEFDKDYLLELFEQGRASDKKHRYQPEIVRGYKKCVMLLKQAVQA